jgi:predicted Zn-dependent protease
LDNTNFSGGGGGFFSRGSAGGGSRASLPLDDDYMAIRHAIWRATDQDYKGAVETLTKKQSYMKDKNIEDRPADFTKTPVVKHVEDGARLDFDKAQWERNLKRLSGHFKKYHRIQDSNAQLFVGAGNSYVVNSEGTRLRTGDAGVLLLISAECQAEDGMKFSDRLSYVGDNVGDLPPLEKMLTRIDEMVEKLTKVMEAPILEEYSGPVLFDGLAAAQMLREMLAGGVVGQPEPVGTQRRTFTGAQNLQKKLKRRILPKSFQIFDDPNTKAFGDELLFGHYRYDDEGVKAQKVDIVVDGKLQNMAMSRAPSKKLSGSNGHGRRSPGGSKVEAAVACLFVKDDAGVSDEELEKALIEAAKDQDLEYGLRIGSIRTAGLGSSRADLMAMFMRMRTGGGDKLGDPVYAYKVFVDDGREELIRGCEFGPVTVTNLKKIVAAGIAPTVYNYVGLGMAGATPPTSIIAPALLFEELDLSKIEQEHDKLPILGAPAARKATGA